jgi:hypothetical protein
MTQLNTANKIYSGTSVASKVYAGTNLVWPPVTYDAATTAWINAVVAAGGSVSVNRKGLIDALIVGLKADGIWVKLDRLTLFANENSISARWDLVTPTSQTTVTGAPPFTPDRGYTVDVTNILNLSYNAALNAVHFAANSAHIGTWNQANAVSASPLIADAGISQLHLFPKLDSDNKVYIRINDAGPGVAISDPRGWLVGSRSPGGAPGNDRDIYQNGTLLGTASIVPNAILNSPQYLYSGGPCAAFSFGGSLTAADQLAFYNRLRTYMTAVGVP